MRFLEGKFKFIYIQHLRISRENCEVAEFAERCCRGVSMKNTGDAKEDQKRKSHIAIQCAKAAILLSSLKSDLDYSSANPSPLQNEETVEKLKIELIIERSKNKKLKLCIEIELLFIFLWTLLLLMAFNFL